MRAQVEMEKRGRAFFENGDSPHLPVSLSSFLAARLLFRGFHGNSWTPHIMHDKHRKNCGERSEKIGPFE